MMKKINTVLVIFVSLLNLIFINDTFAVPLQANFKLSGEINVLNFLRFGEMGIQVTLDENTLAEGVIDYNVTAPPIKTGLLSSLVVPNNSGFQVIDFDFSVPFNLNVGQEANFGVVFAASAIRMVFDFSDEIYYTGSILQNTPGQGLSLNSVTLANGDPLSSAGLDFQFIEPNSALSAFITNATNQPKEVTTAPDKAEANADDLAFASAELNPGSALLNLSIIPEPNPLVFDFGCASFGTGPFNISGQQSLHEFECGKSAGHLNNVKLVSDETPVVPLPSAIWLFGSAILLGLFGNKTRASV